MEAPGHFFFDSLLPSHQLSVLQRSPASHHPCQWVGGVFWDLSVACVSTTRAIMVLHVGPLGVPPGPGPPLMPSTPPHMVLA